MIIGNLVVLLAALFAAVPETPTHSSVYCYQSVDGPSGGGSMEVDSFRIVVEQQPTESGCSAAIMSQTNQVIFRIQDSSIDVVATGRNINGDGHPDAVLESFSGGAHCCWRYSVVSLVEKGGLVRQFENTRPASFEDLKHNGVVEIVTQDGSFEEFERLPHPLSPFPTLILRLNRDKFEDVGSQFWPIYDKRIEEIRKEIKASELVRFTKSKPVEVHDDLGYQKTEWAVLTLVLEHLYAGRPEQAWRELNEMWPSSDQQRIKDAIVSKYCGGLRAELGVSALSACAKTITR